MKRSFALCALAITMATAITSSALGAPADEKPIGYITRSWGPPIPVYKSDFESELQGVKARVDHLAGQMAEVKLPEKDSVEKSIPGALSLARHEQEIAEIRDQFTKCAAIMLNQMEEKEASGTATKEDKAHFEKCRKHCDEVIAKLNTMHLNASRLSTATRQQYILNAWDKHKKEVAELQKMMSGCVESMDVAMDCCASHGK